MTIQGVGESWRGRADSGGGMPSGAVIMGRCKMPAVVYRGARKFAYKTVRRDDGRETTVYLGSGVVAELLESTMTARREQRDAVRAARRSWQASDELMAELDELSGLIAAAALIAAGYHRHDRGRWRKRRKIDGNG